MKKAIILFLSEDNAITQGILNISEELRDRGYDVETRAFGDKDSLTNLSNEDIEYITIIGHANTESYGRWSSYGFVKAFDQRFTEASLDKDALKGIRCIGCGLGLIQEDSLSFAQNMANEFNIKGYNNLLIQALSNFDYPRDLLDMVVLAQDKKFVVKAIYNENKLVYEQLQKKLAELNGELKDYQQQHLDFECASDAAEEKITYKNEVIANIKQQILETSDEDESVELQTSLQQHELELKDMIDNQMKILEQQLDMEANIDSCKLKINKVDLAVAQLRVPLYETQSILADLDFNSKNQFIPSHNENMLPTLRNRLDKNIESQTVTLPNHITKAEKMLEKELLNQEPNTNRIKKINDFIEKSKRQIELLNTENEQLKLKIEGIEQKNPQFWMSPKQHDAVLNLLNERNSLARQLKQKPYINTPFESKQDKEKKLVLLDNLINKVNKPCKNWQALIETELKGIQKASASLLAQTNKRTDPITVNEHSNTLRL